jgi:hypothetical protein
LRVSASASADMLVHVFLKQGLDTPPVHVRLGEVPGVMCAVCTSAPSDTWYATQPHNVFTVHDYGIVGVTQCCSMVTLCETSRGHYIWKSNMEPCLRGEHNGGDNGPKAGPKRGQWGASAVVGGVPCPLPPPPPTHPLPSQLAHIQHLPVCMSVTCPWHSHSGLVYSRCLRTRSRR